MKITIEISSDEWSSVQEAKAAENWQSDEYAVKRIFQHGVSREAQLRHYKEKVRAKKLGEHVEFRPYAPLDASPTARKVVKKNAEAMNTED